MRTISVCRVTSNLVVNDIKQISFVSPVDDSNRKALVDHNTYQNSTTSTNKRGTKETHQLGDELDQIPIEASTLLRQDAKSTNIMQIAWLMTLYEYTRISLISVN